MPSIVTCTAASSALPLHPGCNTATVTLAVSQDLRQQNWRRLTCLSVSRACSRVVHACGGCSCAGRVVPSDACLSKQRSVRLRGAEQAIPYLKTYILTPYLAVQLTRSVSEHWCAVLKTSAMPDPLTGSVALFQKHLQTIGCFGS
jgi:hypothetical protein